MSDFDKEKFMKLVNEVETATDRSAILLFSEDLSEKFKAEIKSLNIEYQILPKRFAANDVVYVLPSLKTEVK